MKRTRRVRCGLSGALRRQACSWCRSHAPRIAGAAGPARGAVGWRLDGAARTAATTLVLTAAHRTARAAAQTTARTTARRAHRVVGFCAPSQARVLFPGCTALGALLDLSALLRYQVQQQPVGVVTVGGTVLRRLSRDRQQKVGLELCDLEFNAWLVDRHVRCRLRLTALLRCRVKLRCTKGPPSESATVERQFACATVKRQIAEEQNTTRGRLPTS
jgi:hypothetical protein